MIFGFLRRLLLALTLAFVTAGAASAAGADPQVLVLLRMPADHVRPGADYGGAYGDQAGRSGRLRIARHLAQVHGLVLVDDWPMPLLGLDCFIMTVPDGRSPEDVAASLAREPGVANAEASHSFGAQGSPSKGRPLEGSALHRGDPLFPTQPAAREWRLNDLHELATGHDVRVAVIDSMVDLNQPDLVGQVMLSQNFVANHPAVPEDHGTGVAGIIAARGDNGVGIVGVAPRARLMALRACWQTGGAKAGPTVCDTVSLAMAIHYAIDHKAQVINLSLSGPNDPLLGALIDVALARGIKVVAAYDRAAPHGGFPASRPGVIAVADELLAPPPPGVYSAPGRDVPTTQPGARWYLVNGSSYAAAHVSGLLALVKERRPLEQTALGLVASRSGGGIDACASLLRVSLRDDCACARAR